MKYFSFYYRLFRIIAMGFRSLWLHRLRSFLTMLGVVFGVASVIAMLAVGEGASQVAQEQIRKLGSKNIIIKSVKPPLEQKATAERSRIVEYGIKREDALRIKESIPNVEVVVPNRIIRDIVWNSRWRVDGQIIGTVSWYPEMRKLNILEGRYFTEQELNEVKNVCVLSLSSAQRLFPMGGAISQTIRVGLSYYKVIGIIEDEDIGSNTQFPQTSGVFIGNRAVIPTGENPPTQGRSRTSPFTASASLVAETCKVYIPITCAQKRFGETLIRRSAGSFEAERVELHEIIVMVDSEQRVEEVAQIVDEILKKYHKQKDYDIIVPFELLRQARRTKQIFNLVLGTIAGISLLVGGIGIMNIMLATVTERTREIGIRRALGAKKKDIVIQFLVETVIMSGTGGIFGILLGFVIPKLITYFSSMPTIVQFWSPLVAFGISAGVGIVFGIYPAFRAANMDPVEALRHE